LSINYTLIKLLFCPSCNHKKFEPKFGLNVETDAVTHTPRGSERSFHSYIVGFGVCQGKLPWVV
jgi:hypothetical protein